MKRSLTGLAIASLITIIALAVAFRSAKAAAPEVKFPYWLDSDQSIRVHCDRTTGIVVYEAVGPNRGGVAAVLQSVACH